MTYRGRIKNGVVVLDEKVPLPEGTEVEVVLPTHTGGAAEEENIPSLYAQFKDFIGIVKGLPPDFARNHDHYIHGTPKK
jgi:predicted DNA-binding antitoxin AbrB/MazE fold protein